MMYGEFNARMEIKEEQQFLKKKRLECRMQSIKSKKEYSDSHY